MSKAGGLPLSLALAVSCGLLFWLAMPPYGLWPLSIIGCALLTAALARSRSAAQAVVLAALSKAAYMPTSHSYLGSLAPSVMILYTANQVLVWALFGAAFHVIRTRRGTIAAVSTLPFLWVLFDWLTLRLHFLPSELVNWGGVFGHTPLRQLAPCVGVYGVTLLAAAAGAVPVLVHLIRSNGTKRPRTALRPAGAAAGLLALALAAGLLALHTGGKPEAAPAPLRVATVGLDRTWEKGIAAWDEISSLNPRIRGVFKDFVRLRLERIERAIPQPPPDIIVLPEDAIDVFMLGDRSPQAFARWGIENNGLLIEAYRDFARRAGAAVLVGLTTRRQGALHNTVLHIGRDGALLNRYDKVRLTAGSEYWPLAHVLLPYWKLFHAHPDFVLFDQQYSRGSEPARLLEHGGRSFAAPVCLEAQMPGRVLAWRRAGAEFLTVLTNSSWFGDRPLIYNRQTLGLNRLLSAAYGIPIFLSGKSNYYGFIDPAGAVSVRPAFGGKEAAGVVIHELGAGARRTAAVRLGEFTLPLSLLGLLLIPLAGGAIRPREK
ncbi:MAG: nitrilase-related carbon-nitrogen hydrolase [Elusimicrobiota bacterium]